MPACTLAEQRVGQMRSTPGVDRMVTASATDSEISRNSRHRLRLLPQGPLPLIWWQRPRALECKVHSGRQQYWLPVTSARASASASASASLK